MATPNDPQPNGLFAQRLTFTDCDAWVAAVKTWSLDFQQLDRGALNASLEATGIGGLAILRVKLSRQFHQSGAPPEGTISVGFPDDPGSIRWEGAAVGSSTIQNFSRGSGFDCVSLPGFGAHTLSIPPESLADECLALGIEFDDVRMRRGPTQINLNPTEFQQLGNLVRQLRVFLQQPERAITPALELVADIRALLAMNLAHVVPGSTDVDLAARQRGVDNAIAAIRSTGGMISIAEVCQLSAISARSLSRGFSERFGLSTKQYIIATRLTEVRRRLKSGRASVTEAAFDSGFSHLGRLSSDYRSMFGELPSQTLRDAGKLTQ